MSDIYIKSSSGTSSTTWRKAVKLFIKTTSGSSSATWSAVKNVYLRFSSGWTRVWPLSGVFNTTSPYITTSSSSTTPLYGVDGVRRVGSTVWGKNGTWDANGWVINSYQYRWRAYSSSEIIDFNLASQTSLATYSGAVSLSIPASYDRKYLSFFIQANSSGGTVYNGYAESAVEYGGLQIVRRQPINLSKSLNNLSPQVGNTISYSSSWDTSDAYAPEAFRTTIEWYRNLNNSTTGGTFITSGNYSYIVQSADLNHYIYAVETTYNSGSDYDLGLNNGVEAKVITTSTVVAGLTPPTSVSVASVSRYSDTETLVTLSHSGGSGPYYQMYWVSSATTPVTASYDAASNTSSSSISEAFSFASNNTYYFYVRSSSQNIATTFTNGTATAGTYSAYSNISPQPFYTFQSPSGATSSITGSTTTGSTLTLTANSPTTAAPSATRTSIAWRVNDGGVGGNSFTGGSILQSSGTTFVIPQFLYGSVSSVGYQVRAEATWNNGVGSQTANSNAITITAPLTKLATPTGVNASDNRSDGVNVTWNSVSGAAYYGVWYGPTPGYDSLADFGGNRNTSLITGTSYLDTDIGTGVTRDYYVQAYRSGDPTGTKSDWGGPNAGTRVAAATPPTGGSVSVNPTSGTAGSTTYTASASGWSGTATISYTFSWQRFTNGLFQYEQLGTGTTFTPTVSQNSSALAWQVVVTASNGVSPNGTASASFSVSNPVTPTIPATPTGVSISGSGLASWNASSGATTYEVENFTDRTGSPTNTNNRLGPFTTTGITSTSLQLGSTQGYASPNNWARVRVRARNSAGVSAYSAYVPSSTTYT
jgi:hypothetical protein